MLLHSCETEIRALKPGNVSLYAHGHGMHPADFFLSARVSAPILANSSLGVGQRIMQAVQATRQAVSCNTNLGIVLLAAPLIRAYETRQECETLQSALQRVLSDLSIEDAEYAFRGISIAAPGGLGNSTKNDVHAAAEVTLLQAMQTAANRDSIAEQYSNGYQQIFNLAVPTIHSHLEKHGNSAWEWRWAAANCYLKLFANRVDSHVFRKHGKKTAEIVRKRAEDVESSIKACENRALSVPHLLQFDSELKRKEINPGTSADLTVGGLLAYQMEHLVAYGNKGWEEPRFS